MDLVLKALNSQEYVLEMHGRQNTLHKLEKLCYHPKSQSSEVATPETSQNSLFFPAALKKNRTTPGRLASYQ
ncbi:hypothetical protein TNCV_1460401 [Trichonephila clavipes]|nr:hypothetical protein TNCV_1460401 [Trichonephila clavipes]